MLPRFLLVLGLAVAAGGVAAADPPRVTFSQHVAPLLQQHCQECHRPGGGAPFALAEYQHVYRRRQKILETVEKRSMHRPMQLIAIHPHTHMLGREMKVWAEMKDKSITPLIRIDDWDFHWQGFYWFRTPVALPPASWIGLTAAWDNSERNPKNPNKPPRDVHWGERSVDEMGHAAILYTLDDETLGASR